MIDWNVIISSIGIGVGGLATAGFLVKWLITHLLDKDLASFKQSLQHAYDTKLEELKSSHAIKALEFEAKYNPLHQRRLEVIAELYGKLAYVYDLLSSRLHHAQIDPKIIDAARLDAQRYYSNNKIFFSEHECELINTYLETIIELQIDDESANPAYITTIRKKMDSVGSGVRTALEKAFRPSIGL